ncbi:MAG: Fic family protein [Elusimicrobiales bacterium]|nr:Fic family protein [Elusimicrobiales bacterium]
MESGIHGGIYHRIQVDLTYNSNHIEGSTLTHEQTRFIFETKTVMPGKTGILRTDDIVETSNHFKCIDMIIKNARRRLNAAFIKELHRTLKNGTSDSRKNWFAVGEYKKLPNEVGGNETARPEDVSSEMSRLLKTYNYCKEKNLDELLDFHWRFERIHPFQDGNGRIGRLILFKECLRCGIVPFIITEELKLFYYRGLAHWPREKGYLRDTCLAAQDQFKKILDYFRIRY